MSRLLLSFLGPPRIDMDGNPVRLDTRKAIALLAYLGVTGEGQSRDSLVTLLWGRYGRAQGQAALRRTLSTIRAALGPRWLQTTRDLVELELSTELVIDVQRVKELLMQRDAHDHGKLGVCPACIGLLSEAAHLFRGEFLTGFTLRDSLAFDDWQFFMTEDFRLQSVKILDALALCYAAAGDYNAAIGNMRLRLNQDPLDENAHVTLMQFYAWSGNRSAALRQFGECARILRTELNSAVRKSTEQLNEAIRKGNIPQPPMFGAPAVSSPEYASSELSAFGTGSSTLSSEKGTLPPIAEPTLATVLALRPKANRAGSLQAPGGSIELAETLSRRLTEVIVNYRGQVAENSAPGMLARFGDRTLLESNPELAVRAALELEANAAKSRVEVTVGVATGHVSPEPERFAVSNTSAVAGKAIARAVRLAERSLPGRVVVDEHTFRLTRDLFSFEPITEVLVAAENMRKCYRVRGIHTHAQKTRGLEARRSPFVGRDAEVRILKDAYGQTVRGHGQVVIITGEAGIGKSRLVEELRLCSEETAEVTKVRWLEGRCLAPSVSVGYWPFVDMLNGLSPAGSPPRGRCGNPLGELPEELTQEGFLSERELNQMRPVLANLFPTSRGGSPIDPDSTPEHVKHMTFVALQSFFHALAKQRPIVLVFEDLHWADDLSLELIDSLLDSLAASPALLVCIYRPDPTHKSRHLSSTAARRRNDDCKEIHLREITRENSECLLENLLPVEALSGATREHILRDSQGNPYFLEELVRSFADGEFSVEKDARVCSNAVSDSNGVRVPEGIKRVVLSRFYGLPTLSRRLLSCAAVIGRVFRKQLLSLSLECEDLLPILEQLEDRELLFVERTVPETEYSFKHVLAQEAIYEALDDTVREELHRRVAGAYEHLSTEDPGEYCEQLAFHYDHGGQIEKAIEWYHRAGEKARRAYANEAAIAHLSRGLSLLRGTKEIENPLSRELDFLIALGVPLVLTRGHQSREVEASYLRAKAICEQTGTANQWFQVILGLRRLYFCRGEHRKERELAQQMLEVGLRERDAILMSRAHMMLAETLFALGDFTATLKHAESGSDLYDPREQRMHLMQFGNDTGVGCQLMAAEAQWSLGFPDQALRTIESTVARARELAHPFTLVFALHNAALVAYFRRDPRTALRWSQEVISISGTEDFPLYRAWGPILYGWALGMLGDCERGISMMQEGRGLQPRLMPFQTLFACMLAEICQSDGKLPDALSAVNEGLAVAHTSDSHLWEPELNRVRGEIGVRIGESATDAEPWFLRSLRLARKQHAKSLELRSLASLCRLYSRSEKLEERRGQLQALCLSFTEGEDTADLREARGLFAPNRS